MVALETTARLAFTIGSATDTSIRSVNPIGKERRGLVDLGVQKCIGRDQIFLNDRVRRGLRVPEHAVKVVQVDAIQRAEAEMLVTESGVEFFLADGLGALRQDRAVALRRPRIDSQRRDRKCR